MPCKVKEIYFLFKVDTVLCKLQILIFSCWFMTQGQSTQAICQQEKKQRSVPYSADQANEVSKIFIISLRLIRGMGKERKLA